MDSDIFKICNVFNTCFTNGFEELTNALQEETERIDAVYNELLQSAQNFPAKNTSKEESKTKNGQIGDVVAGESSFQQPAVPPIRRTKRQASIMATDKIRESSTISSGSSTRASRARALSTFMDLAPIACPAANSTFVVDKKFMKNLEECVSPEMFSPDSAKENNANKTYDMPKKLSATNRIKKLVKPIDIPIIPEEAAENTNKFTQPQSLTICNSRKKSPENQTTNKQHKKIDIIDVTEKEKSSQHKKIDIIDVTEKEKSSQHMTRTMKRKLQEDNNIDAKKTNVLHVPLEKQIFTPKKPLKDILSPTLHQVRENEAEKRKELHLKSKADQRKFDAQHLKAAKQREQQMRRVEERIKKTAEEKKKKEEKQKEKEIMMKEEALKKQKQAELRLAEINTKRKLAEEAKHLKLNKLEIDRKKEIEIKKKIETKSASTSKTKLATLPIVKIEKTESNKNDYGLNDISARDSSEDESGPKKPIPNWAKRENRKAVLELQYHLDSKERDLFFDCPKSMSLKEMFKGWNIRDKQRTSSAVWNTPPRYSEYIRRY